jgi:hypothetical protein
MRRQKAEPEFVLGGLQAKNFASKNYRYYKYCKIIVFCDSMCRNLTSGCINGFKSWEDWNFENIRNESSLLNLQITPIGKNQRPKKPVISSIPFLRHPVLISANICHPATRKKFVFQHITGNWAKKVRDRLRPP